jgi:hypothetical protein
MASKAQKKSVQKDVKTFSALEAVRNSEGGQIILTGLRKDILATIDAIVVKYKEVSHPSLIALSAKLAEKLALYRTLSRSSKNKSDALAELKILLEEPEDEE